MKLRNASAYFAECEKIFDKYNGRPHWGKYHTKTPKEFAEIYPKWKNFLDIRNQCDPSRVFSTLYIDQLLGE
jgi:L-gulonolactone oxidase